MRGLVRAPLWLIVVLLLAAIGVGVYGYFTTPLPLGLSSVIRTPGGESAFPAPVPTAATAGARTPAGQPLVLGATSVAVQSVLRNQDLTTTKGGPPGVYTILDVLIQNAGTSPITPKPGDFQLQDERGRTYAIDPEATRSVNSAARRRLLFDASVPPSGTFSTLLAFETPGDAASFTLRVSVGYGDLELPASPTPSATH
jgi:hypothetical protein